MGAGSFEPHFVFRASVYQNPIGFDVAISPTLPSTFQGVVLILRRQRFPREKDLDNRDKLLLTLALLDESFDVPLELRGLRELH